MKAERAYPRFTITAKGTRWVEGGHPWIYAQEIVSAPEGVENGALVDAVSEKGKYLGSGFFSRESKIRIRLLSRNANDRFDADFWRRRIRYAWDYRKTVMGADVSCCRVIFGEADGFPGLTVDRFENLLVTQTLSVGMERIKEMLFPLLVEVLAEDGVVIDGVFERNTLLTRPEQRTMLTLWSIFRSPLMLGCELTDLDEWTLGLITNPEVLALLKDSRNAREILNVCDTIAWQAEDEQGNTYLAVFNLGNLPAKREITLDKLGLSGEYTVHDLWGDQPDAVVSSGIVSFTIFRRSSWISLQSQHSICSFIFSLMVWCPSCVILALYCVIFTLLAMGLVLHINCMCLRSYTITFLYAKDRVHFLGAFCLVFFI